MKNKGFTLIELLAVITIMALLAVIMIPKILERVENEETKIDEAKEAMIKSGADTYLSKNLNDYPSTVGNIYCIDLETLEESGEIILDIEDVKKSGITYVKVSVKESSNLYSLVKDCQEKRK